MREITRAMLDAQSPAKQGMIAGYLAAIINRLLWGEYALAVLLSDNGKWPAGQPLPAPPAGHPPEGDLEFGDTLYLLNNIFDINNTDVRVAAALYVLTLDYYGIGLPQSALSNATYDALSTLNLVGPVGEAIGTSPYELYDQNWLATLMNLFECCFHDDWWNDGVLPLPDSGASTVLTPAAGTNTVTVALVSDWGSNAGQAPAVMAAVANQQADAIVHLGDVYYSGTPSSAANSHYISPTAGNAGEEQVNLIDAWPTGYAGKSFTMNSNHEMYTGGGGLFGTALADPIFAAQQGASVFVIQVGDWSILGLDSAFYADPFKLFMEGTLDAPGATRQADWIKGLGLNPAKTIVLTHHDGFDTNCDTTGESWYAPFRAQVTDALGNNPYAWFWGHVHNGLVYADTVDLGGGTSVAIRCRCIGHAALPYGRATDLTSDQIVWQAGLLPPVDNLLPNGFATLTFTLSADGTTCTGIEEAYFTTAATAAARTLSLYPSG